MNSLWSGERTALQRIITTYHEGKTGRFRNETFDCFGVCNGNGTRDSCGHCATPPDGNPGDLWSEFIDCNRTCGGTAAIDDCGMCTGGATGLVPNYAKDACNVCNGTNTTCAGCDGVPNSNKEFDACRECDGDGSTCTDIMATVPRTLASSNATVLVIGAGLNKGAGAWCRLSHPETGNVVVNTTAQVFNLTHAKCVFQPWTDYTAGVYNLTVLVEYGEAPNIVTNTSLQIYYYSASNLSLIAVDPSELLKDQLPKDVHLVGSGFFHWTESVCFIGSWEVEAVYVNSTHLKCHVGKTETSDQLPVSLSMDGGLVRVGVGSGINLTIFARAPSVDSVKFSDTAAKILVTFNTDANLTSEESCDEIFTARTVSLLGTSPSCVMSSTIELQISPGIGSNITTGNNLEFKDNVIKAWGEMYSKFLSGSHNVSAPDSPVRPVPVITGPSLLSSCGNLTLLGYQSIGGGGRQLNFKWTLISPSVRVDDIKNKLSDLPEDADEITLSGTLLSPGMTYQFQLGVANFFHPDVFINDTLTVTKATDPVPAITISSNIDLNSEEVSILSSENLSITATAIVAPCVNNTKVDFLWKVNCTDVGANGIVESSSSYLASRTQSTLRIDGGVLTSGLSCTFIVQASMNYDPSVQSSTSQEIRVFPSPIIPVIFGGDQQFGQASGIITFDAESSTTDPDNKAGPLSCIWRCEEEDGTPCRSVVTIGEVIFASLGSHCVVHIGSSQFKTGKKTISVYVTKDTRTETTSIVVTVVEGDPPLVQVPEGLIRVSANERVPLEGYFVADVDPSKLQVQWTCVQEQGFSCIDLSDYSLFKLYKRGHQSIAKITLEESRLTPGAKYRFKLVVNDGRKDGAAFLTVEVRNGPTSGTLVVDRTSVQALETITLSAPFWITDSDARPLKYKFGVESGGYCQPWGVSGPIRSQLVPSGTPPDNVLTLCVLVTDKYGSAAKKTLNITSTPTEVTTDAVENLFDSDVKDQLESGNVEAAVGALISLSAAVQDSENVSESLKRNVSQKTQEVIEDIVDSNDVDADTAEAMLTALTNTDGNATKNGSKSAGAVQKLLTSLQSKTLNDEQAGSILGFLGQVASTSDENYYGLNQNVKGAVNELGSNMAKGMELGDRPREATDPNIGTVRVSASTLQGPISTSDDSSSIKIYPGAALGSRFAGTWDCGSVKNCTGVHVKTIKFSKDFISVDNSSESGGVAVNKSQIVGLEVNNPYSGAIIVLSGLSPPLRVEFVVAVVPDGKRYGCNFFDETTKSWSTEGMTVVEPVNNVLGCESNHATFFAPSHDDISTTTAPTTTPNEDEEEPTEIDNDNTWAIVGGVLGGIVFVVIIIVVVVWCTKKKKESQGRVSPVNLNDP